MRIKFFNPIILSVALIAGFLPPAHGNGLINGSFERKGDSDDTAYGWNRWGQWINRETDWQPTHSGQCLLAYHHWQIEDTNNSGVWQDISNVKKGERYTFSVYVWMDKIEDHSNPAKEVELRLEATRGESQVTIQSAKYSAKEIPSNREWHRLSVTGTTPEDNLRALLVVTPADNDPRGGAVKFDDARIERVSDDSGLQ